MLKSTNLKKLLNKLNVFYYESKYPFIVLQITKERDTWVAVVDLGFESEDVKVHYEALSA